MRMRWRAVWVAIAVALGGIALHGAIAQPPAEERPGPVPSLLAQRPGREEGFLRNLNLTPDQMRRIRAIRSQYQGPINQRRQSLRQAQQELGQLMAGTASRGTVQAKFRQVETLRQQLADLQFNSTLEIREVLTPEQRRKFAESMQNRRKQFKQQWKQRWQRSPMDMTN